MESREKKIHKFQKTKKSKSDLEGKRNGREKGREV
jgi:hypothetical protein